MNPHQRQRAETFRDLHHRSEILVLPNCWDVASARVFELAGATAVATTSAGLANSLGYPDGHELPRELLVTVVRRICELVAVPVTVDLEMGYGTTPGEVAESVGLILEAGAVGINIEDHMDEPAILVAKIAAVRETAARAGVPLFVNGRTDVYLRGGGGTEERFEEAARRLRAYAQAGADGVFAPGLADPEVIGRLARAVDRPLNVMAFPGVPAVPELERLGVKRVSVGGGPMRAVMALTRRIARELLDAGTYGFAEDATPNGEANAMFAASR